MGGSVAILLGGGSAAPHQATPRVRGQATRPCCRTCLAQDGGVGRAWRRRACDFILYLFICLFFMSKTKTHIFYRLCGAFAAERPRLLRERCRRTVPASRLGAWRSAFRHGLHPLSRLQLVYCTVALLEISRSPPQK